ncbi:hypothetical protein [Thermomonospora cellulosilytica]|uniref:DUF5753 domain-containing protein n=1 Tax=Thermomonospora cellulosilytica TaxID=1411118 RepID=A0A7W3MW82_9ACTN|nr:hypothetical protein [Thermomonospora cellulosilytica]MBA9003057.1 hypothetical protein [Thermomonospora cellulosilytica]
MWPEHTFVISDTELVTVERVSGFLPVSQPAEAADYLAVWKRLTSLAVTGHKARQIITRLHDGLEA